MSLTHAKLLPLVLIVFSILAYLFHSHNLRYFKWIHKYWFFKRSKLNTISFIIYLLSILLFSLSLLDLRGPIEMAETKVNYQKTIILIDTSASMMAEDVLPNRFKKALLIARLFIKKAVNHQISIVLFSDTHKRIAPFTNDSNLLDSRLSALESLYELKGGSNIIQGINESLQYFKTDSISAKDLSGNILLLTDAEGHDLDVPINFPKNISLAAVGIGTISGGDIPLRSKLGTLRGFKRFSGEKIYTKLNENFLKRLKNSIPNFKYWIALSYSMPTEEILTFLKDVNEIKISNSKSRVRPVYAKYILIPAILFFILSMVLSQFRSFKTAIGIIPILVIHLGSFPLDGLASNSELQKEIPAAIDYLKRLKKGNISHQEKLKLAELLLKNEKNKAALALYDETIGNLDIEEDKVLFNYATALLVNNKIKKSTYVYNHLKNRNNGQSNKLTDKINSNLLLALNKTMRSGNKSKKGTSSKNGSSDEQSGKSGQKGSGQSKKGARKSNGNNKKDKFKRGSRPQHSKNRNTIKKGRKLVKIPAILKQILDDDKNQQRKWLRTSYQKGYRKKTRKDW